MSGIYERLPKRERGHVIALLVLTIFSLPWPLWNSVYGWISTVYLKYGDELQTIGALGTIFAIVTISDGLFGLVKLTIFAMDLDLKISPEVRSRFLKWYLILDASFMILTLAFGLPFSLIHDRSWRDIYLGGWVWILMGLTAFFKLFMLPFALMLRSSMGSHKSIPLQRLNSKPEEA